MKYKIVVFILLLIIAFALFKLCTFNVKLLPDGQAEEASEMRRNIVLFLIGAPTLMLICKKIMQLIRQKVHKTVMKNFDVK